MADSKPKRGRPTAVGEALQAYLAKSGLARRLAQAQGNPDWPRLVGAQTPAGTWPEGVLSRGPRAVLWAPSIRIPAAPSVAATRPNGVRACVTVSGTVTSAICAPTNRGQSGITCACANRRAGPDLAK